MSKQTAKVDEEWLREGVDIWLIRDNLSVSYETRVARHQDTLNCIEALKEVRCTRRAKPSKTASVSR